MMKNKLVGSVAISFVWVILLIGRVFAGQIEVIDKNGNILAGSDMSINENGVCTLVQKEKETSFACANITEIILNNPVVKTKSFWEVVFSNNDLLYGKITGTVKNGFSFKTNPLGEIELSFNLVLKIRSVADPDTAWKRIPEANDEDIIYFLSGDQDKGIVKEISHQIIEFQSSVYGRDRHYKPTEVAGIAFAQIIKPSSLTSGLTATIISIDRSHVTGLIKKMVDGLVHFHSDSLGDYQIPMDKIVQIYFRTKQYVYLSDMEPIKVKEYPTIYDPKHIFFPWSYQKDKNVTSGGLISFKGKEFYKGLGVHANCELTYELSESYKKFSALVGLDNEAGPKASVEFLVFLDNRPVYKSGPIKWGDDPKQVEIDVTKAKEMRLVVTDGGDMHVLDRAAWANARLVK